jgi:hypothetical protein
MGAPRHRLRRTLDALSSAAPVAPAAVATSSDVPYPAFRVAPRFVSDARLSFFRPVPYIICCAWMHELAC